MLARSRAWRNWLAASLVLVVVTVLCVRYVDRPLALLMANTPLFGHFLKGVPVDFPILVILAVLLVLSALGYIIAGKPPPRWMTAGAIAGLALILSVAITECLLKHAFGRLSLQFYIHGGRYGFYWFHQGEKYRSFPSGHTDQAASVLSVLWAFYPRWRWTYVGLLLLLSFALIAGGWHFLSDIIAGAYVGTVAGAATMALCKVDPRGREHGCAKARQPPAA